MVREPDNIAGKVSLLKASVGSLFQNSTVHDDTDEKSAAEDYGKGGKPEVERVARCRPQWCIVESRIQCDW